MGGQQEGMRAFSHESLGQRTIALRALCTLRLAGLNEQAIAEAMGIPHKRSVSKTLNSPAGMAMLDELQRDQVALIHDRVMGIVEANTEAAARKIALLMESESDTIKLRAAQDILDRAGRRREKDAGGGKMVPHVQVNVGQIVVGGREGGMPTRVADGLFSLEDVVQQEVEEDGSS